MKSRLYSLVHCIHVLLKVIHVPWEYDTVSQYCHNGQESTPLALHSEYSAPNQEGKIFEMPQIL